jgi:exodeoxyribonuclease X
MDYFVTDTETTGMDQESDAIVEFAAVGSDGDYIHTLIDPGDVNMSYGAMAAHHLPLRKLRGHMRIEDAIAASHMNSHPDAILVMHNAEFDMRFLRPHLHHKKIICTWKVALTLVPDAESHGNGSLWYELGLDRDMPEEAGSMPHRALFDSFMTWDILRYFLKINTLDDMVRITENPVLLRKCSLGKYRGELWENVDSGYMRWCLGKDFDENVKFTCNHWLEHRRQKRAARRGKPRTINFKPRI